MIIDYTKIILIFLIGFLIYFINLKIIRLNSKELDIHQKFSSDYLGNPIGGYIIFIFIISFNFYSNYLELFFLLCVFLSGVLSDNKLLNSPKKRLLLQVFIIVLFITFSEIEIISTRIHFLDKLLNQDTINILFTSFCILIVINGSNFMDGLNGVVLTYYLMITSILLISGLDLGVYLQSNLFENLIFILFFLLILNYLNIIFLGDNGAYLIGFLFSIFLIKIHQININLSPYFIILLLWYPSFENLFSILRKNFLKTKAIMADNNHLHQLIFFFFSYKLKIKKKLIINNLTSLIISLYHLPSFLIGFQNYDKTNVQIYLIVFNLISYLLTYVLLFKFKKNLTIKK